MVRRRKSERKQTVHGGIDSLATIRPNSCCMLQAIGLRPMPNEACWLTFAYFLFFFRCCCCFGSVCFPFASTIGDEKHRDGW